MLRWLEAWRPRFDQRFFLFVITLSIRHCDVVEHRECFAIAAEADHVFVDFDTARTAEPVLQVGGFL